MNQQLTESLQSSWRHAEPIADTVIRLFYRRLFQIEPQLRERFCTSMSEQGDQLREAAADLVRAVSGGDKPAAEVAFGAASARECEASLVSAWLWALEQEIGGCALESARDAWRRAIGSDAGSAFRQVAVGELALVAG